MSSLLSLEGSPPLRIDVNFDHRTDSNGKDPDSASATLRRHHQILWSKSLPSGELFALAQEPGKYLVHRSHLGDFSLSSDTISNSIRSHKRKAHIISQIPAKELDEFQAIGSTVGATIIFPANRVENKPTINVARGFNSKIGDRIDLTLECIRLYYLGQPSPLAATLGRYADFFGLFETFEKYVGFFLLEDLISGSQVDFFLPYREGFESASLPMDTGEYRDYMANTVAFVSARNLRMKNWASTQK